MRRQQLTYQVSAIAATTGVSALAILATYYKFSMHMAGPDTPFPWLDMFGTLALVVGGVAGMEMWARWAHKVLWHDFQPGWALHKSHHVPRVGPFEVRGRASILARRPVNRLVLNLYAGCGQCKCRSGLQSHCRHCWHLRAASEG